MEPTQNLEVFDKQVTGLLCERPARGTQAYIDWQDRLNSARQIRQTAWDHQKCTVDGCKGCATIAREMKR